MLEELFSSGPLNLIYASIVAISFVFALLSLIGAEIGEVFDFDFDVDGGEGGFDFISLSPFAIATFGVAFGLAGLVTHLWLEMSSIASILWATGSGVLIGGAAQAFFIYVLAASRSSHYSLEEDAIGREAEVIITIPAKGLGKITFNNVSGRVTMGARSADGRQIENGGLVVIDKVVGRIAIVQQPDQG